MQCTSGLEKTVSLVRYGATSLAFNIQGLLTTGAWLNFFGSVPLQFAVASGKTVGFLRSGITAITFNVKGLMMSGAWLDFFGSVPMQFTALSEKTVGFIRNPTVSFSLAGSSIKQAAFQLSSIVSEAFAISSSGRTFAFSRFSLTSFALNTAGTKTISLIRHGTASLTFTIQGLMRSGAWLNLFGSAPIQLQSLSEKAISFIRNPSVIFSFNILGTKTFSFPTYGIASFTFVVASENSKIMLLLSRVTETFTVSAVRSWSFSRSQSVTMTILANTLSYMHKIAESSVTQHFTPTTTKTVEFIRYGTVAPSFTVLGYFTYLGMPTFLELFGSVIMTLQAWTSGFTALIPYAEALDPTVWVVTGLVMGMIVMSSIVMVRRKQPEET
jgi:hypothetical protein